MSDKIKIHQVELAVERFIELGELGHAEAVRKMIDAWIASEKRREEMFVAPTIEEVRLHCAKSGINETDGVWFWHKCDGNDWKVAGKKMKRWRSVIMAWKIAGYLPSQKLTSANSVNGKPRANELTVDGRIKQIDLLMKNFEREGI